MQTGMFSIIAIKRVLEEDYGFQMSKEVESEVGVMHSYTDIIIEKAEAKGKLEGQLFGFEYTLEEIEKAKEYIEK